MKLTNFSVHQILQFCPVLAALLLTTTVSQGDPEEKTLTEDQISAAFDHSNAETLIKSHRNPKSLFIGRGVLCCEVVPGSFAEKAGLKSGCLIAPVGRYLPDHLPSDEVEPSSVGNFLVWSTPDGTMHRGDPPEGKMGIVSLPFRSVVFWYLNHGQRKEAWDALAISALDHQNRDTSLAEALWSLALEKGYQPDAAYHWSMAFICADQQDFAACKEHIKRIGGLTSPMAEKDFPLRASDLVSLGVMTGDMSLLKRAAELFPHRMEDLRLSPLRIQKMIEFAERNPLPSLPPSEFAEQMKRKSFLREATLGPDKVRPQKALAMIHRKAAAIANTPPFRFNPQLVQPPPGHYSSIYLFPPQPARDLDASFEFSLAMHSRFNDTQFMRGVILALHSDFDAEDASHFKLLSLELGVDGNSNGSDVDWRASNSILSGYSSIRVRRAGNLDGNRYETLGLPIFSCGPEYHTGRVVKVGGWVEALVDGKRVALLPSPPDHDAPFVELRVIGSKANVRSLRADILE